MKKLSIFIASMAAVLGFTSCEDAKDPVLQTPTTFEMNVPAMQDQYLDLSVDGGTFELVAKAQPDYGYSAITIYSALVSLTPDFAEAIEMKSNGTATQSRMVFNNADLALNICKLKGVTGEDNYVEEPAIPVYFKGVAELKGVEGSRIVSSNYVVLKQVKYYFAVPTPHYIYGIGAPSCFGGWTEPKESNKAALAGARIFEADDAIGSNIYTGVFNIPAGQATFRFYTELTGWDGGASVGLQVEDNAVNVALENGQYFGELVKGKGSISIPDWTGGDMTISVNLNEMTVTILAGAQEVVNSKYAYMIGNNSGWATPDESNQDLYNNWRLVDKDASGVYTGTFEIGEGNVDGGTGNLFCRFQDELTGWADTRWSSSSTGDNVDVVLGSPMPCALGQGCFVIASPAGKTLTVTLNANDNTATFVLE